METCLLFSPSSGDSPFCGVCPLIYGSDQPLQSAMPRLQGRQQRSTDAGQEQVNGALQSARGAPEVLQRRRACAAARRTTAWKRRYRLQSGSASSILMSPNARSGWTPAQTWYVSMMPAWHLERKATISHGSAGGAGNPRKIAVIYHRPQYRDGLVFCTGEDTSFPVIRVMFYFHFYGKDGSSGR
jgi:hypothetical protein